MSPAKVVRRTSRISVRSKRRARCIVARLSHITRSCGPTNGNRRTRAGWRARNGHAALFLSMAHEIDAIELVAEALAGGERGLEIALAEHIGVDLALRDDGGVARLAADQRNLAEEITGAHACD